MGLPFAAGAAAKGASNQWVGSAVSAGIQSGGGIFGSLVAKKANKEAWKRSVQHEQKVWERDAAYNSPQAQMERLKAAGLNPNLMYGQGTVGNTTGTPVKSESFIKGAEPFMAAAMNGFTEGLMFAAELRKKNNEADLVGERVGTEGLKQELTKVQTQVLKANPYLNPDYVSALVSQANSEAVMKDRQSTAEGMYYDGHHLNVMERRILAELKLLEQKYDLGTQDQKIKAEIFNSKQFQNDLQEIQVKWMKDGEINSEHIRQFIIMLFQKLM